MKSKKTAFTLIELLVVIAIIGILATVSILSLTNARAKSRDAKRAGDMKQVQTALELFFNDKNRYPTAEEWNTGQIFSTSTIGTSTYMQIIPSAPTPADGSCGPGQNSYNYAPIGDGNNYCLDFCVGGVVGQLDSGRLCATPAGILNGSCCGKPECSPIVYGGQSYNTVKIDDQCWFKENLNYGTRIDGVNNQADADAGTFEKYCSGNLDANCIVYGGLYQWHAMMALPQTCDSTDCSGQIQALNHQGICPDGWHIPTDAEQYILENYLKDLGQSCDANRSNSGDCISAGTKLQVGGTSGFEGLLAGIRGFDGSFVFLGTRAYFWSSFINGTDAWYRLLASGDTAVYRYYLARTLGFSVRCLQN